MGGEPNPWELLHPQDEASRLRDTEQPRRCDLSGATGSISPEKLLSLATAAHPHGTAASLGPAFAPARPVGLSSQAPLYPWALLTRFPTVLRVPLGPSVAF